MFLTISRVKRKVNERQPLDLVRNYFGSSIAFFFAFSAHLTNWMISLSLFAILQLLASFFFRSEIRDYVRFDRFPEMVFCAIAFVWSVLFLLHWTRKANTLRSNWNLLGPDEG